MNNIPKPLNEEMNEDPYYKKCCLAFMGGCAGRIQRHHALTWKGSQYQKKFCILPACEAHHEKARGGEVKERFDWILLNRASDFELLEISKAIDYRAMRDRLNLKYGRYNKTNKGRG